MADTADGPGWDLAYYGEQLPEVQARSAAQGLRFRQVITPDGFEQWVKWANDEDAA
jgi:hypothetical protein